MFTGLIRTQGTIRRIETQGDTVMDIEMDELLPLALGASIACHGMCLTVTSFSDEDGNRAASGEPDSVGSSVGGTINHRAPIAARHFTTSLSAETLRCTNAGTWRVGTRINLEPSLSVGDAMGGHFVSGHVDGLGSVVRITPSGASTVWEFAVPPALARYIAPKGSITIDGVSLTVNEVRADSGFRIQDSVEKKTENASHTPRLATPNPESRIPNPSTTFTINIIPHTAAMTGFGTLAVGDSVNLEIDMLARYVARLMEAAA